ncbi:hypothetical protein FA15DRAFT_667356 [Coprinopsis marcescibilis]|uniref:Uncharacterized protein n=1 Tax=Coprinopsis marcescibilis TaxID=230819 RepID=A0A5C3L2R0_COPMA|nr:hypothetical protein FA15DRAFT_667356 [Coprinopsis marcescibilis]
MVREAGGFSDNKQDQERLTQVTVRSLLVNPRAIVRLPSSMLASDDPCGWLTQRRREGYGFCLCLLCVGFGQSFAGEV